MKTLLLLNAIAFLAFMAYWVYDLYVPPETVNHLTFFSDFWRGFLPRLGVAVLCAGVGFMGVLRLILSRHKNRMRGEQILLLLGFINFLFGSVAAFVFCGGMTLLAK
jgi:uncharacterized membrane protein HdeD (DUF308 family)